jgi:hypothetical protein
MRRDLRVGLRLLRRWGSGAVIVVIALSSSACASLSGSDSAPPIVIEDHAPDAVAGAVLNLLNRRGWPPAEVEHDGDRDRVQTGWASPTLRFDEYMACRPPSQYGSMSGWTPHRGRIEVVVRAVDEGSEVQIRGQWRGRPHGSEADARSFRSVSCLSTGVAEEELVAALIGLLEERGAM